jgi:uncharacterized membrane protein YphA (DoxX/SURF4 family)
MRRTLFVLGRAIFGSYFIYSGVHHFLHEHELKGYAASKGTPGPDAAVLGTGAMLVAGGASVLAGVRPHRGLATLIAFLVPTSLMMHRFWEVEDAQARQNEMINFSKNMALVGAMLMMMELDAPWPASAEGAAGLMKRGRGHRRQGTTPRFLPAAG